MMNEEEEEKREATYNYLKANMEFLKEKNDRKKTIILIVSLTIIILTVSIYSVGGISLPYFAGYLRRYDVRLNDVQMSTTSRIQARVIWKNLLEFHPTGVSISSHKTTEPEEKLKLTDDKYTLSVQSYSCYFSDVQMNCDAVQKMEEKPNNDTSYKLRIYSHKNFEQNSKIDKFPTVYDKNIFYDLIYEDKFINDITPYIANRGQYIIEMEARYGPNTAIIMTVVQSDGNEITIF